MNVVVTGGAGFIGSPIVSELRARGDDVVVIDHHASRPSDLCDDGVIETMVTEQVDVVVHLAARTSVLGTLEDPLGTLRVNVDATARLAEQCRRLGVGRLVFASTNAVVGTGVEPGQLIDERSPLVPLSPYGASKAAAEAVLSSYRHAHGLETTVLRLTNVYGPTMVGAGKDTAVVRMMKAVRRGVAFDVFGTGEQDRDFVFIDDVVRTFVAAIDGQIPDQLLTVGAGRSVSVLRLAAMIGEASGGTVPLRHLPAKVGEMPSVRVDISRARSLGLEPDVMLAEGLAVTWEGSDDR